MQSILTVETSGPGLYEFTHAVQHAIAVAKVDTALCTLFCRHTSCSLLIQENVDPDVRRDLDQFFQRLVPSADDPSMAWLVHRSEGNDDMPAHIKAALTQVSLSIPVMDGKLALGIWQGIYVFEHRFRPHRREVVVHIAGD
ncbi:MAG: secondary thiamine-phosphate synthase enzyme YjbQ [Pseudomonadota bacterium]